METADYDIVIFLNFDNSFHLVQLRNQYDPLASAIAPHITLVYPFLSELSAERIINHINHAIQGIRPFQVRLQGITGSEGEYLFLNIQNGNDQIIELYNRLYTGVLEPHLSREHTYLPHMTIGRLNNCADFLTALEITNNMNDVFDTVIKDLSLIRGGDIYPIEHCFDLLEQ